LIQYTIEENHFFLLGTCVDRENFLFKVNRIISEGKVERDFNVYLVFLSVGFCLSKADKSTFYQEHSIPSSLDFFYTSRREIKVQMNFGYLPSFSWRWSRRRNFYFFNDQPKG